MLAGIKRRKGVIIVTTDGFVPVKEIALYFGVTTAAIYNYIKQGKIDARRIGGAVRITRAEFDRIKAEGLRDTSIMKTGVDRS
jgi:excisionase family DNA binding protein